MATAITTSPTNVAATAFSNQKKAVTLSEGTKVAVVGDTTTNAKFWYRPSGGSWTDYASDIAGWSNGSITAYVDSGGTERLVVLWKQTGVGGTGPTGGPRSDQRCYAAVGTFNAGRTALTWGAAFEASDGSYYAAYDYPDIDVHPESTGAIAHFVFSYQDSSSNCVLYSQANISSLGVISGSSNGGWSAFNAPVGWNGAYYSTAADTFPSVVVNQADKRVHITWSAGASGSGKGARYRTGAYSGGSWSWATEVELTSSYWVETGAPGYGLVCRWDAPRSLVVIAGLVNDGSGQHRVVWDSSDFTTFTLRVNATASNNANNSYGVGAAVDSATGDVYVFGSQYNGSKYADVAYYKCTRSGSALSIGSRVITDTFALSASGPPYVYAWPTSGGIDFVYTRGTASPYSVSYDTLVILTAVGDTVAAQWSVQAAIGDTNALRWSVRTTTTDSNALQWSVRTSLADTNALQWAVRSAVGDSSALQWSVLAAIGDVLAAQWSVRTAIADTLTSEWSARTSVGDLTSLQWALYATVGDAMALQWAVRRAVGDMAVLRWVVQRLIAAPLRLAVQHHPAADLHVEMS